MKRQLACIALLIVFAPLTTRAANISLVIDSLIGGPLTMLPNTTSDELILSVQNDTFPNSIGDFLAGYQVVLQIVPQAAATGSLAFAAPVTGSGLAEPANYVFNSVDHFGLDATNSGNELFLYDLDLSATGVDVSTTPGNIIASITVLASADANGLFDIVAVPGPSNSEWIDDFFRSRDFANVPIGGGPVVIGQILVVPEPSGLALCSVCLFGYLNRRRR